MRQGRQAGCWWWGDGDGQATTGGKRLSPRGNLPRFPGEERAPVCATVSSALQFLSRLFTSVNQSVRCSQIISLMPRLPARLFCILQTPNEVMRRPELDISFDSGSSSPHTHFE